MNVERALRLIAGAFVVLSVLLGMYVHPGFLWFSVFVGANLFQSAFTNWCPMMSILRKGPARLTHTGCRPPSPGVNATALVRSAEALAKADHSV
jgi:hypothetical protein